MRIALYWLAVAGCFAPTPPEGIPCGEDLICPDPLTCSLGKCVADGTIPPVDMAPVTCSAIEAGTGKLTIPRVTSPIVIDGTLDDWSTCFIEITQQNAGLVRDLNAGGFTPGRFSIAADADHLYVAAEVTSLPPLGNHAAPDVYLNNAISVYFDADGSFGNQTYDSDAAQIVVDHANRYGSFHTGAINTVPDLETAAKVGASTFTIEMSLKPTTLNASAFGSSIGFDIGLVGGDGQTMSSELVWFVACQPPQCGCTNNDAAPYCDARELGVATFAP